MHFREVLSKLLSQSVITPHHYPPPPPSQGSLPLSPLSSPYLIKLKGLSPVLLAFSCCQFYKRGLKLAQATCFSNPLSKFVFFLSLCKLIKEGEGEGAVGCISLEANRRGKLAQFLQVELQVLSKSQCLYLLPPALPLPLSFYILVQVSVKGMERKGKGRKHGVACSHSLKAKMKQQPQTLSCSL